MPKRWFMLMMPILIILLVFVAKNNALEKSTILEIHSPTTSATYSISVNVGDQFRIKHLCSVDRAEIIDVYSIYKNNKFIYEKVIAAQPPAGVDWGYSDPSNINEEVKELKIFVTKEPNFQLEYGDKLFNLSELYNENLVLITLKSK